MLRRPSWRRAMPACRPDRDKVFGWLWRVLVPTLPGAKGTLRSGRQSAPVRRVQFGSARQPANGEVSSRADHHLPDVDHQWKTHRGGVDATAARRGYGVSTVHCERQQVALFRFRFGPLHKDDPSLTFGASRGNELRESYGPFRRLAAVLSRRRSACSLRCETCSTSRITWLPTCTSTGGSCPANQVSITASYRFGKSS